MSHEDKIQKALEDIAARGNELVISVEFEQGFNFNSFVDETEPTVIVGNVISNANKGVLGHYRFVDQAVNNFVLKDASDNIIVDDTVEFWATNEQEAKVEIVEIVRNYAAQYLL